MCNGCGYLIDIKAWITLIDINKKVRIQLNESTIQIVL